MGKSAPIGDSRVTLFCNPFFFFCTGQHVLDEGERSLHDALCVLTQTVKDSRVIYGGGWSETQVQCRTCKEGMESV